MALVGDLIMALRELVPDLPQVLPTPTSTFAVINITGSGFITGTYWAAVSQLNPWGETLSVENTNPAFTISPGQGVQVTSPVLAGANRLRLYMTIQGGASGSESMFVEGNGTVGTPPSFQIQQATPPPNAGFPPLRSSAFLPDTDGNLFSTSQAYRWLNRALVELSRMSGGLRDYSGVGTVKGQNLYTLTGNWNAITDIWYNGYWMQGDSRGNFFRRNQITAGILTSASMSIQDNRNIIEVFPQPDRTAGTTILTAAMTASSNSMTVSNSSFLLLPFGFLTVDSELMSYSFVSGNTVSGLIRGLGGTTAVSHLNNAPVGEINLVISGRRVFAGAYIPGNSLLTLPVPAGWEDILPVYMFHLFLKFEKDYAEAANQLKQFGGMVGEWTRQTSGVLKRRQIGAPSLPEVYYGGVPGAGGNIIP